MKRTNCVIAATGFLSLVVGCYRGDLPRAPKAGSSPHGQAEQPVVQPQAMQEGADPDAGPVGPVAVPVGAN